MRRSVVIVLAFVLPGCAATPAATPPPEPTATPVATASSTATPSAEPTPAPTLPSSSELADEAPPGAIHIMMGDNLEFEPTDITVPAGTITFYLENRSLATTHDFHIGTDVREPALVSTDRILGEQNVVLTVEDVPSGTYAFWCEASHHYLGGMVGTLTVTP